MDKIKKSVYMKKDRNDYINHLSSKYHWSYSKSLDECILIAMEEQLIERKIGINRCVSNIVNSINSLCEEHNIPESHPIYREVEELCQFL